MAFQPAIINASGGLMAAPAIGAPDAASSTGDAGLFQSLLAGATTGSPATSGVMNTTPQAAPSSGALALLLQTQDAPTAQATTAVADQSAPATTLDAAMIATAPAESGATPTPAAAPKPQTATAGAPANPVQQAAVNETPVAPQAAEQTNAPAAASAVLIEAQSLLEMEAPETVAAAPSQNTAPVTPDAAQAIIFAPFAAAPAPSAPTAALATPARETSVAQVEQDGAPQAGPFKKTAFVATAKAEPSNGAVAKIASDSAAAPQTQIPARTDTAQPGAASPISGFDAPRPAADAISTPVARALHGAAAMQVAQQVARRFDGQSANFEVRLDPAELGRVDVKITVDHDKRVTAAVSADSAQTLSDLRGAARDIERALNEAGLDLAQGGLSFDLNQRQASDEAFDAKPYPNAASEETGASEPATIAARPFGMERWSASGVDVWA